MSAISGVGKSLKDASTLERTRLVGWLGGSDFFEPSLEEPQFVWFIHESETADGVPLFEDGSDRFGDHIHMRLGVDPAGEGQSNEFELGSTVLARGRITAGGHHATFHAPHPRVPIDGGRQRLSRKQSPDRDAGRRLLRR